jgi:hypothetical protein
LLTEIGHTLRDVGCAITKTRLDAVEVCDYLFRRSVLLYQLNDRAVDLFVARARAAVVDEATLLVAPHREGVTEARGLLAH